MFSVMYTGMNFLPLCTATVWPTNSGGIVVAPGPRLEHLLLPGAVQLLDPRSSSVASMYGPFFSERPIACSYFFRRVTMKRSDGLAPRRVL